MPSSRKEKTDQPKMFVVPQKSQLVETDDGTCPKCFGTGMEPVEGGVRTCECRRKRKADGQLATVKLPKRYADFHFNSFKPQNPSQNAALKIAMNFVREFPAVDRGLLMMGSVGVGKTHLAVSILKGLTERGFDCLFYEFSTLLKEIQDSYNPQTQTSELSVLSPIYSTEVLVLDELGATKPTDWVRDTITNIINSRYNERKFTIFTTNYFDERTGERDDLLEDRIGIRARSRLYEMCKTVGVNGEDFRKIIDRNGGRPV